jgi:hypothetical protein
MPELPPRIRKMCLRSLYRMCGHHALLPRTLKIPVCYDRTGTALYRGGFADVWKGQYCGRDVAVKVIRTYSNDDLQRVIGVGYWSCSLSACLRVDPTIVEVLQGGCDVEDTPTSEHPAADRSDDVRDSVCDGIRLDGQRKHQQLCEGAPGCESVGTGRLLAQTLPAFASSSLMIG